MVWNMFQVNYKNARTTSMTGPAPLSHVLLDIPLLTYFVAGSLHLGLNVNNFWKPENVKIGVTLAKNGFIVIKINSFFFPTLINQDYFQYFSWLSFRRVEKSCWFKPHVNFKKIFYEKLAEEWTVRHNLHDFKRF